MAIAYEEKLSQSPLVDFVFQSEDLTDGVYVASADARWDIIFTQCPDGKTRVLLCGPSFKVRQVPYSPGYKHVGICYKPWAMFTGIPNTTMLNEIKMLPMVSLDTFMLQGITWKMPTYENVDQFVAEQEKRGLLKADPMIRDVLENRPVRYVASFRSTTFCKNYWHVSTPSKADQLCPKSRKDAATR